MSLFFDKVEAQKYAKKNQDAIDLKVSSMTFLDQSIYYNKHSRPLSRSRGAGLPRGEQSGAEVVANMAESESPFSGPDSAKAATPSDDSPDPDTANKEAEVVKKKGTISNDSAEESPPQAKASSWSISEQGDWFGSISSESEASELFE